MSPATEFVPISADRSKQPARRFGTPHNALRAAATWMSGRLATPKSDIQSKSTDMTTGKPIRRIASSGPGASGRAGPRCSSQSGHSTSFAAPTIAPDGPKPRLKRFVQAAWPALERLGLAPAHRNRILHYPDMRPPRSCRGLVQENGPERDRLQRRSCNRERDAKCRRRDHPSSSSGLHMSEFNRRDGSTGALRHRHPSTRRTLCDGRMSAARDL